MNIKFKIATNIRVKSFRDKKDLEKIKSEIDKINIKNGNIFEVVLGDNIRDFEDFKIYNKGIILNYTYYTDTEGLNSVYGIDLRVKTSFKKEEVNTLKEIFNFITNLNKTKEKCLIEIDYIPFLHGFSNSKYNIYLKKIHIEHEFKNNYENEIKELFSYIEDNFIEKKSKLIINN